MLLKFFPGDQGWPLVLDPVLLGHFNSSVSDDSDNGWTLTPYTNAPVISSAESKFGGSSLYFSADDEGLILPDNDAFVLDGDFTIDAWVYPGVGGNMVLVGSDYSSGINNQIQIQQDGTAKTHGMYHPSTGWLTNTFASAPSSTDFWHIAFTRSGSTLRVFQDGTAATLSSSSSESYSLKGGAIGALGGYWQKGMQGYIDELRIVKGTAKWTSNFTPPTGEY